MSETQAQSLVESWNPPRILHAIRALAHVGDYSGASILQQALQNHVDDIRAIDLSRIKTAGGVAAWINADTQTLARQLRVLVHLFHELNADFIDALRRSPSLSGLEEPLKLRLVIYWRHIRCEFTELISLVQDDLGGALGFDTLELYTGALQRSGENEKAREVLYSYVENNGLSKTPAACRLIYCQWLAREGKAAQAISILEGLADAADASGTDPVPMQVRSRAQHMLLAFTRAERGLPAALAELDARIRQTGETPLAIARRIRLLWRLGGVDAAEAALREALEKYPLSIPLLDLTDFIPLTDEALQDLARGQLRRAEGRTLTPGVQFHLFRLCWIAGLQSDAAALAKGIESLNPAVRICLDPARRASSRLPGHWPAEPFETVPDQNTDLAVVVVSYIRSLMANIPRKVLDSWFAARKLPTVYCRDFTNQFFMRGVADWGDSPTAAELALQSNPVVQRAKRLLVIGVSGSGFPAIKLANALQADHCITFSPKTTLLPLVEDFEDFSLTHGELRFGGLDEAALDLAAQWPRNTRVRTEIFVGSPRGDRAHAERIADREGVVVHELADMPGHEILSSFALDGSLDTLLDRFVQGERDLW
ncbi:MAG: hypothetical protein RKE49_05335 [Oceanicaulis sp.]